MSLTIFSGPSGSGKTYTMLTEVIRRSLAEPSRRFLVIVPEQFTMQTQRVLVDLHPNKGIFNLEVTSLNRLAQRVLAETGRTQAEFLEEIGKSFLIEKTILEKKAELCCFEKNLTRPEHVAEMKSMISELMLYDVKPEEIGAAEADGLLGMKLHDVEIIYRAFREKLEGTYLTIEEMPDRLVELAESSVLIRDSVMVFDGFTGFTPVQLKFIEKILPLVPDVYISLTADPETDLFGRYHQSELFSMSYETAGALKRMADKTGTKMNPIVSVKPGKLSRQGSSPVLQHLEKQLFRRKPQPFSCGLENAADRSDIRIISAANPRTEVEEAARQILRLVRDEGFRYRDIAILSGDLETYGTYAREVFAESEIPCFVDEKRKLLHNPLIEYLRAAIETAAESFSYESMFRMLKSGMTDFDRDEIDRLENYVLGTGLHGKKKWHEKLIRHYRGEDAAEVPELDALRVKIMELLDPLDAVFARRGSTVGEKVQAVLAFCEKSRAEEKLAARQSELTEQGKIGPAKEYAQVWPYVSGFLEKLEAVLGDESISMQDFAALLEAGFAEAKIAIIPPGNDRVVIGDMERSRIPDVKVLIFLGMNEGIIPKPPVSGGILTDLDRRKLEEQKIRLKPTAREAMYIERFYLYLALTKPSERLYISYSTGNAKGETIHPAYVIGTIKRLFPDLTEETVSEELQDLLQKENRGISLLAGKMQLLGEQELSDEFLELFSYYRNRSEYTERIDALLRAAGKRKPKDAIGKAAAEAIYGKELVNSATRLEQFCECEFRHFLKYGLRLQERPSYEFTGVDTGTILHRSLELCSEYLKMKDEGERCSHEDLMEAADRALETALHEESVNSVLFSDARSRYQMQRMRRLMRSSADALGKRAKAGEFSFYEAEQGFKMAEELELYGGSRMQLIGKIDRIDTCADGDVTYVKVTDYKTGNTKFDLRRIYYGLQLQLALYMNAAIDLLRKNGKHPMPAGMFYFPVQDPMLDYDEDHDTAEDRERRRLEEMKGSGVVNSDETVLRLLDRDAEASGKSAFLPVSFSKKGGFNKSASVLDAGGFKLVGDYAKHKAKAVGTRIMNGDAEINPYQFGNQENACRFCPYHTVCGFDRRIRGFDYRNLDSGLEDPLKCMFNAMYGSEDERELDS